MVLVYIHSNLFFFFFFFQAEDGIRDYKVLEFRRVLFRSEAAKAIRGGAVSCALGPRKDDRSVSSHGRDLPHVGQRTRGRPRARGPEVAACSRGAGPRSEERRVGKECRSGWARGD